MKAIQELGDRRTRVLRAVVRDYIRTGEPVGSTSLAKRYRLNVSPATIRNDMAALEELGFLMQPHTSAGRIPTDLGYRFYVDTLAALPELSPTQRRTIVGALDQRVADVEDLMRKTAHVLAGMTHYAAVALPPVAEAPSGIARADLVPVAGGALLLTVDQSGRVSKRLLDLSGDQREAIGRAAARLTAGLDGLSHAQAAERVRAQVPRAAEDERPLLAAIATAFDELDLERDEEHVYIGGVGNIAGEEAFEHRATLRQLFEALDEEATILRLLHRLAAGDEDLAVRIGQENPLAALREASVVVARYRIGEGSSGTIAVIGPTRMEYPAAMSATRAVADRLSDVVHLLGG